METKQIGFTVEKYYTDADGNEIDKSTLPANLKSKVPFYLFGQFDRSANFALSRRICPPLGGTWTFVDYYVSNSYQFLALSGANGIRGRMAPSDLVFCYVDDPVNQSYYCWIIISGRNQPIASIFDNLDGSMKSTKIKIDGTNNTRNFFEDIFYLTQTKIGDYKSQSFTGSSFVNPLQDDGNIADINLEIVLTIYFSLCSYILFETDELGFNFTVVSSKFDMNNKNDFVLK